MGKKFEESAYQMWSHEPVTPSEIDQKLGISHKTALRPLISPALMRKNVCYRDSGRIRLFWRKSE